jgi:H+/Cl- antiporter ClcA
MVGRWTPPPLRTRHSSLFSGAVLGPEGGIGGIASKIAAFYSEKVGIPVELRSRLVFASIASAYNGLVANPLFTGVLATELIKDPDAKTKNLPADLIGGSIGFLIFFAIGSTGLEDYLHLAPDETLGFNDILVVIGMALIGMALAVVAGIFFRVAASIFARFEGQEVVRALVAGVIFSVVGIVAPILLFSGESQIREVSADPAQYGPLVLIAMAVVKLALLAVAFKGGFLGGPTFPAIFASVCIALAVTLLVPSVTESVAIGGVMAGALMVLFRAPFMVILLTSVLLQAGPELVALIVLAVATVMIALPYVLTGLARGRTPT